MNTLILAPTRNTPGIHFDPEQDRFELVGNSTPENASAFYEPVIRWLEQHLPQVPGPRTLNFRLTFFNSSSLKAIYQMLQQVQNACLRGVQVKVCWYAEADDDLFVETVAMLSDVLEMPMELVPIGDGTAQSH
jgi:hypothetical protein